jgi:hypothetical protein
LTSFCQRSSNAALEIRFIDLGGSVLHMDQNKSREMPPGLALRVAASILIFFGGLIIAIIFVAFFAPSFNTFQKIAVILVVILAIIAIMGAMWTSWGMRYGMRREKS